MIEGVHLTPIGKGNVLLEPGEPNLLIAPILELLLRNEARRLVYDLKNVRLVDSIYYAWLNG